MASTSVKRAFRYRFYPTDAPAAELSRTFGCVRLVHNRALAERTTAWHQRRERVGCSQTSAMLTAWKRAEELSFLAEVSCVPLQQTPRHLRTAFRSFFDRRARYPRFKSKKTSRASAEYTRSALRYRDGHLTPAKTAEPLDLVWSRPLPEGAGLAVVACGAGVRPQRESSRTGRPATKQEGHGATRDGARASNHR
jgi:putative transposase